MDNKGKFTITNEEGKELECEVLFTFDSDEFKKSYIVFTDGTLDDNGNIKLTVYVKRLREKLGEAILKYMRILMIQVVKILTLV